MSYGIPSEIILLLIIMGLASILIYLSYQKNIRARKTGIETFVDNINPVTSYSLYTQNQSTAFDQQMKVYKDTLYDKSNLLHIYGCGINIGTAPNALDLLVTSSANGLYIVPFDMLTIDYNDVNTKVYKMIQDFYDKNGRSTIQGQIYVVLSQAPFYRDDQGNMLALQYNADSYLNLPKNVMKNDTSDNTTLIQFYGYIIFTAYRTNEKLIKNDKIRKVGVLNIKKNFRHKQSLCFIKCPLHSDVPCGCASQDAPYMSNCLESENPTKMSAGQKYSYAILYRVNPLFSDLFAKGILAADYSDLDWSPDTLNPIPTLEEPNVAESEPIKKPYSGAPGIIMYQHCGYKGWESQLIPPGRYTMDHLTYYGVKNDVSTYKVFKDVKVKLYLSPNFENPISVDTNDGYITGSLPCFTKYKNLNDNLEGIEILYNEKEEKREEKRAEKREEKKEEKKEEKREEKRTEQKSDKYKRVFIL